MAWGTAERARASLSNCSTESARGEVGDELVGRVEGQAAHREPRRRREPLHLAHHQAGGGAALQKVRRPWPARICGGAKQVLFGDEDILVNNIAWALRHLPVFAIFGSGEYRLQPIHVDDFAALAVKEGQRQEDIVIDAVGPETFSYRELVERLAAAIRKHRPIISVSPSLGYVIVTAIGRLIGDVVLTRDEIKGLMADLLVTNSPPVGSTKLTEWAKANADSLGRHYASELARRTNRDRSRTGRD